MVSNTAVVTYLLYPLHFSHFPDLPVLFSSFLPSQTQALFSPAEIHLPLSSTAIRKSFNAVTAVVLASRSAHYLMSTQKHPNKPSQLQASLIYSSAILLFLVHQPALPSWLHAQEDAARAQPCPSWDGFLKEAGGIWQCQHSKTQAYPHVSHLHEGVFQVPLSTGQRTAAPLGTIRVFSICSCYLLMPHCEILHRCTPYWILKKKKNQKNLRCIITSLLYFFPCHFPALFSSLFSLGQQDV